MILNNKLGNGFGSREWQQQAECRGPHSTVFFAPSHLERKTDRRERERQAKAICATCTVSTECLEYSMKIRDPHGIWGGLTEAERRAERDSQQAS